MPSEDVIPTAEFDTTLHSLFDTADTLLVVNPTLEVFQTLILTASEDDAGLPTLKVLATPDIFKAAVEDFILASQIADLIAAEKLMIRTKTAIPQKSLFVSSKRVMVVVSLENGLSRLTASNAEYAETVLNSYHDEWETGDEFNVRTPPLSRIRDTLRVNFGDDVEADFMMMLESMETVPGEEDDLDEVAIALLVAAKHNELFYEISKWGEDIGLASKATFSRVKTRLENRGVIDTEKTPTDLGRPRLRLLLVPDNLHDIDELADQVTAT